MKDVGPDQETIVNAAKEGNAGAVANEFGAGEQGAKSGSDGTRPRSTVRRELHFVLTTGRVRAEV